MKRLPANAPGKAAYVRFLKDRYANQIGRMNEAYKTSFTDFDSVLSHTFPDLSSEGSREYLDDLAFHGVIAEQYYSTSARFIKKHDPNHLIFGDRFKLDYGTRTFADEGVLQAAGKHVDVISVEPNFGGDFLRDTFDALHKTTGRPIMIGDHDVMGLKRGLEPAQYLVARGRAVPNYLEQALATGYIVGYGKCMYFDRPGESLPRGLVDANNAPRMEYLRIVSEANKRLLRKAYEAGADLSRIKVEKDIAYGDHERQKLDLAMPKSSTPTPLIIWVHGGGWRRATRALTTSTDGSKGDTRWRRSTTATASTPFFPPRSMM